jgi:hypothetical protein
MPTFRSKNRRTSPGWPGGFACLGAIGFFWTLMGQGDTNSIGGVCCVVLALFASRRAQAGRRWGGPLMAAGLALALYTHAGFFLYGSAYLVLESIFYRDRRAFVRYVLAAGTAVVMALPLYWELIRYPAFFATNNVLYAPAPIDWPSVLRRVYYNFEMSLFPHRWFNDYGALTNVMLPVVVWVARNGQRRRPMFYAWCAILTMALLGFDVVEFGGYLLAREFHMLAVFTPVVIAWFIVEQAGRPATAWALVAVTGLYMQGSYRPIPHVANVREFDPALVDRLATLDGPLVLLEGNPHRDLIVDPNERPERTPWGIHFDSMIAAETDRRYYAQTWDGFHWTPFRGQTVAGGAFRGKRLDDTPLPDFVAEMRKWGVRHLVVWSTTTKAYLDRAPAFFDRRWSEGRWVQYEMRDADVRDVVVPQGAGRLGELHPLGGVVHLTEVRAGEPVIVRTNYFPAWTARAGPVGVPLRSVDGQLAFDAPADGTYDVALEYPRRTGLIVVSLLTGLAGGLMLAGTVRRADS